MTPERWKQISRIYEDAGDYERAEPIARQSMTLFEKLLGPEHPGILPSLENLAAIEQGQCQSIGERWSQLLHQIKRQAWPSRAVAMQEADRRTVEGLLTGFRHGTCR